VKAWQLQQVVHVDLCKQTARIHPSSDDTQQNFQAPNLGAKLCSTAEFEEELLAAADSKCLSWLPIANLSCLG